MCYKLLRKVNKRVFKENGCLILSCLRYNALSDTVNQLSSLELPMLPAPVKCKHFRVCPEEYYLRLTSKISSEPVKG